MEILKNNYKINQNKDHLPVRLFLHEYHCMLKCCPLWKNILYSFVWLSLILEIHKSYENLSSQLVDGNDLEGGLTYNKHGTHSVGAV